MPWLRKSAVNSLCALLLTLAERRINTEHSSSRITCNEDSPWTYWKRAKDLLGISGTSVLKAWISLSISTPSRCSENLTPYRHSIAECIFLILRWPGPWPVSMNLFASSPCPSIIRSRKSKVVLVWSRLERSIPARQGQFSDLDRRYNRTSWRTKVWHSLDISNKQTESKLWQDGWVGKRSNVSIAIVRLPHLKNT